MKFGTKAIHKGLNDEQETGAIIPPIYQTSTYIQKAPGDHKGYEYSRTRNPTRTALENNIAAIENAKHGFCFGSGMGAIDTVVKLFKSGDEIIANNDLYGGTYRIFTKIFFKLLLVFNLFSIVSRSRGSEAANKIASTCLSIFVGEEGKLIILYFFLFFILIFFNH